MTDSPTDAEVAAKPSIGSLEADIAFFDARRALLLQQPDTAYKRAQLKICDVMQQSLRQELLQVRQQQKKAGGMPD